MQLTDDVLAKAEDAAKAELKAEGKPEQIWDRILPGKMERFIADNTTLDHEKALLDQNFIMDDKKNVGNYVTDHGEVSVVGFKRVTLA
ncbi:MAG: elongation factor Ts [Planctomycetota bacterium]|jgi:elongation factor Ts